MINQWQIAETASMYVTDVQPSNYGEARFLDLGATVTNPNLHGYWTDMMPEDSAYSARKKLEWWVVLDGHFVDCATVD